MANYIIPYIMPMIFFVTLLFTGIFLVAEASEWGKQDYDVVQVHIDRIDSYYTTKNSVKSKTPSNMRKEIEVYGSYEYKGVQYTDVKMTQHESVKVDAVVEMCVDPSDPTYVFMPPDKVKYYGLAMIAIAILIAVFAGKSFIKKIKE